MTWKQNRDNAPENPYSDLGQGNLRAVHIQTQKRTFRNDYAVLYIAYTHQLCTRVTCFVSFSMHTKESCCKTSSLYYFICWYLPDNGSVRAGRCDVHLNLRLSKKTLCFLCVGKSVPWVLYNNSGLTRTATPLT